MMVRPRRKQKLTKQTLKMHTKNPGHLCEIDWKIDNVLKFPHQTFSTKVKLDRRCRTNINMLVKIRECENYSNFFIDYERLDRRKLAISVNFDFQLVNANGDIYMQNKARFSPPTAQRAVRILRIKFADPDYFENAAKVTEHELRDPDDDILKNLISKELVVWDEERVDMVYSLPGDSIQVKGSAKVFACCVPLKTNPVHQSSECVSEKVKPSKLSSDFYDAFVSEFEDGNFTDITLHVQDGVIRAHKFILSARSPKFKRLLEPDSDGNSKSLITIDSVKKYDFVHFLYYLYAEYIGEIKWETLEKLYEIAIDFEVDSLLKECRHKIIKSLKDKRACKAMLFAEKHKDDELKTAIINFIKVIFFEFQKSSIWITFRNDYPGLANEIMHFVVADLQ